MKLTLSGLLCCPTCRSDLSVWVAKTDRDALEQGILMCGQCSTAIPVVGGFVLSSERFLLTSPPGADLLERLSREILGNPSAFNQFLEARALRPLIDSYAAFMPFNESTRALLPLLPLLRSVLRPGDVILDTWCRTGWQGELLAGLFPQQQIVSIWEGNRGLLGYRAFHHWLGSGRRAPNLEVVFHSCDDPFPFRDGSFKLVVGLDSLHRYRQVNLLPECLRVCGREGVVVFPHVHLSNNNPDPFFDRGGTILHGRDYAYWGQGLEEQEPGPSGRQVYVLSEKDLFETPDMPLQSVPDTSHYNGLILVAPRSWAGQRLSPFEPPTSPSTGVFINPLLALDLHHGRVSRDPHSLGGQGEEILSRHPLYTGHLPEGELTRAEVEFLYLAQRLSTLGEISASLDGGLEVGVSVARSLARREIVCLADVSPGMGALQRWIVSNQVPYPDDVELLWQRALKENPAHPWLAAEDGSVFSRGDGAAVVDTLVSRLMEEGLKEGDPIVVAAPLHVEAVLVLWASLRLGLAVTLVDPAAPVDPTRGVLEMIRPRWVVGEGDWLRRVKLGDIPQVSLDEGEVEGIGLAEWMGELRPCPALPPLRHPGPVCLLTSGTTGTPRRVALSARALCRSALRLLETYPWLPGDVVASTGALHTMSGLRNPVLAPWIAGCTLVIPDREVRGVPLGWAEWLRMRQVTVLCTGPALLRRLLDLKDRLPPRPFPALRLVMSTADFLPVELARALRSWLGVPVVDYYGLTETCGLCLAVDEAREDEGRGTLGWPVDCVAQVVDDEGRTLADGEVGELRIFNHNHMIGYVGDEEATTRRLRGGWIYTGDWVRRRLDGAVVWLGRRLPLVKAPGGELLSVRRLEQVVAQLEGVLSVTAQGVRTADGREVFHVDVKVAAGQGPGSHQVRQHVLAELGPDYVPAVVEVVHG